MKFFSLKLLLFGFYISFGCIPLFAVSYLTTTNAGSFVSYIAQNQMEERSRILAMQMNERLLRQQRELLLLASLSAEPSLEKANIKSYLQENSYENLFALQQTLWKKGAPPIAEDKGLLLIHDNSEYKIHFYRKINGNGGYIERIIPLAYVLAPLYSTMGNDITTYSLLSPDGKLLWHSIADDPHQNAPGENAYIQATYPISKLGLLLQIQVPKSSLFEAIDRQERKNMMFVLLVTILASMAAFSVSAYVSYKLKLIVTGTSQLAKGNFDYRIPKQNLYEMTLLSEMVNTMGEQLKSHREQVIQAEKLSSLGMFSVEMAHELKNPLAGMKASAQLLSAMTQKMEAQLTTLQQTRREQADAEADDLENENIEKFRKRAGQTGSIAKGIDSEIDRLSGILQDLLFFAKPTPPRFREVSAKAVVDPAVKSLYAQIQRHDIAVAVSLEPASLYVDTVKMLQVLVNLLANAVHAVSRAMQAQTSGQGNGVDRPDPPKDAEWPPNTRSRQADGRNYVVYGRPDALIGIWLTGERHQENDYRLTLRDTGVGIAPEILGKIFDPFFSLGKKGHGLGLSIVQSLCRQNNVDIEVRSVLEKGTTFTLHFHKV